MLVGIFSISFLVALFCTVLVIRTQHIHGRHSVDFSTGIQKFHVGATPRVGGIPIMLGLCAGGVLVFWGATAEYIFIWKLIVSSLPVFLTGLKEDLTKTVSPFWRLVAAFASAGIAILLFDTYLQTSGFYWIDTIFSSFPLVAILITIFAVGGVCHSINIIDGYNGLMPGVVLLVNIGIAYVALAVGDIPLLIVCLALAGSVLGFMIWNFPRGLIFSGDAGAYLLGFILAQLSVLLVARNPDKVSPWFPLLLLIYPVFETVFSMYRKKFIRKMSPGLPDGLHFHMLVYKRLVRWMVGSREAKHITRRNSLTAPYLWGVAAFSVMPALIFWKHELMLQLFVMIFIVIYLVMYNKLINFRSPKVLVIKNRRD